MRQNIRGQNVLLFLWIILSALVWFEYTAFTIADLYPLGRSSPDICHVRWLSHELISAGDHSWACFPISPSNTTWVYASLFMWLRFSRESHQRSSSHPPYSSFIKQCDRDWANIRHISVYDITDDTFYFTVMDKYHKWAILVGNLSAKITYTTIQKFEVGIYLFLFNFV